MILAHPQIDTVLELSGPGVCTLVVENPDFFRGLLTDLYAQLGGEPGQWVLSDREETLAISKWVELVDNCIHFELNRKSLLNKICGAMERMALSETCFLKTAELLRQVEAYLDELAFALPCDITSEKCSAGGLIKAMGLSIRDDYDDPLERLADLLELVREFDRDKLFILVGMRSLFGDERVAAFLKTVYGHGYRVLLLDCQSREKLPGERRVTIDNDLCEF